MGILDWFRQRPVAEQPRESRRGGPEGGSGRGHTHGFLELEELNPALMHPLSHRVYDRMYRTDSDVKQVISLTANPITGGTWSAVPFGGEHATDRDREVAEDLQWAVFEMMNPNLIEHLIEFLPVLFRSAFAPGEITWRTAERDGRKLLVPARIGLRLPRSVYRWEQRNDELLGIWQTLPAGNGQGNVPSSEGSGGFGGGPGDTFLPRRNLVYYRVGAEGDNWEGVSMLRPAYKHWVFKDAIERIDAIGQEKDAMGTPICYPPPGASAGQLDEMEEALSAMRANEQAYIIMPGMKAGAGAPDGAGWLVEILGHDRSGTARDPQPSLEYHSRKIAAAFISEFMRLGHGTTGARATAQVQADPFLMAVEAVVGIVEGELNRSLVLPFIAHNYPDVKDPPKLKMSLVDSTSLSQLADFVLKLTQVGALLPDRELEDFLRARADLPPINAEAAKDREADEDDMRRRVVGALEEAQPDPFGAGPAAGAPAAGKGAKKAAGKRNGSPGGSGAAGSNPAPRGAAKNLDDSYEAANGVWLSYPGAMEDAWSAHHGSSRWWELMVDLDGLERRMDGASDVTGAMAAEPMYALAREMADEALSPLGEADPGRRLELGAQLLSAFDQLYDDGARSVIDEVMAQRDAYGMDAHALQLDRGARDRGREHLQRRAAAAAARVEAEMAHAMLGADLTHGQLGRAQMLAERAGLRALKAAGHDHGVAALIHGRHDQGDVLLAADQPIVTATYTAKLDRASCAACAAADDDVPRALDDPVRLERQPPNPDCASAHSGANRCRCIEVFHVRPPTMLTAPVPAPDGMPDYLARIVELLIARGMEPARALGVAVNVARGVASTGHVRWPGLRQVGAGDRSDAAQAIAWWDAAAR